MSETHVGLLYKISCLLPKNKTNSSYEKLKSYYLMRCIQSTKGFGLPSKQFSSEVICQHCGIAWNRDTKIEVKPLKLSKKQRRRLRNKNDIKNKSKLNKNLLYSNQLEKTCTFCNYKSIEYIPKPHKKKIAQKHLKEVKTEPQTLTKNKTADLKEKQDHHKNKEVNIYSATKDIFSLRNANNSLSQTVNEPKVIKNSKKKKDKFAGLCGKAVLAATKLKEDKKTNKLNLFLKPTKLW